jgi:hypothetical protein
MYTRQPNVIAPRLVAAVTVTLAITHRAITCVTLRTFVIVTLVLVLLRVDQQPPQMHVNGQTKGGTRCWRCRSLTIHMFVECG